MIVTLTDAELWAFNLLNSSAANAKAEFNRVVSARDAYIQLLESKYIATFNPTTGQLEPKEAPAKDDI